METKKNRKADLSKKSILFFQIGLIFILLLAWQALEWKAYNQESIDPGIVSVSDFEDVEIPVLQVEEPTPLKLPKEIFQEPEVIDDESEVEETLLASTETNEDQPVKVEDIKVEEPEEPIDDYPIILVEEVPVYPGCEGLRNNEERMLCMSGKITKLVSRKFDTSLGSKLGLSGTHRIYVSFKILPDGSVTVLGARGPHPLLEEEAIKIAKSLPEMQPGKQGGKPVGVLYSLPITFRVQD